MHTLIIGYGNCLREDDGVGPAVAEEVESWQLPGVQAIAVHQLVPELVEVLKNVQRVLFVDASREPLNAPFIVQKIEPQISRRSLGHADNPANLLALTLALEGRSPDAWLLAILPYSLKYGTDLADIAKNHMEAALIWIRNWLARAP